MIVPPLVNPVAARELLLIVVSLAADTPKLPPRPVPPFVWMRELLNSRFPADVINRIDPPSVEPFAEIVAELILKSFAAVKAMIPPGPLLPFAWIKLPLP